VATEDVAGEEDKKGRSKTTLLVTSKIVGYSKLYIKKKLKAGEGLQTVVSRHGARSNSD